MNDTAKHLNPIYNLPSEDEEKELEQKARDLITNKLIDEITGCLKLEQEQIKPLRNAIYNAYHAYHAYLEAIPKSTEVLSEQDRRALKKICTHAGKLQSAIYDLEEHPLAANKFIGAYKELEPLSPENYGLRFMILNEALNRENPFTLFEELVVDILAAADDAAFNHKKFLREQEMSVHDLAKEEEETKDDPLLQSLAIAYGDPKHAPIRSVLFYLKIFWDNFIEEPFSAGRHYKEIGGYNSPTIEALEIILSRIEPNISQRNIVTHMLSIKP